MNVLEGRIAKMNTYGPLTLVRVKVEDYLLSAIVTDTPETASYLRMNHPVKLIFKETEVIIGIGQQGKISLRNQFKGKISKIKKGALQCKLSIATDVGQINSIITVNAVEELGLEKGKEVLALVKTNEMMLSE
ncbi:MAG: TOBE domain-containing protein [Bacteroidia bacterium]|nr:TOBE domain-containing protein [Bacteroidia bacterium]